MVTPTHSLSSPWLAERQPSPPSPQLPIAREKECTLPFASKKCLSRPLIRAHTSGSVQPHIRIPCIQANLEREKTNNPIPHTPPPSGEENTTCRQVCTVHLCPSEPTKERSTDVALNQHLLNERMSVCIASLQDSHPRGRQPRTWPALETSASSDSSPPPPPPNPCHCCAKPHPNPNWMSSEGTHPNAGSQTKQKTASPAQLLHG